MIKTRIKIYRLAYEKMYLGYFTVLMLSAFLLAANADSTSAPCNRAVYLNESACTEGFVVWNRDMWTCIKIYQEPQTYDAARNTCRSLHADLMTIEYKLKEEMISPVVKKEAADLGMKENLTFWIGLNDIKKGGNFEWTNKMRILEYTNWQQNEPSGYTGVPRCVSWEPGFKWTTHLCSQKHAFVCEREYGPIPDPPKMNITPGTNIEGGKQLQAKCEGFVADIGELRFELSKEIVGDGASGYVILADDPAVDYFQDRKFVINPESGRCERQSKAILELTADGKMNGARLSCCAFLTDIFAFCYTGPTINVYFVPKRPALRIAFFDGSPFLMKEDELSVNCTGSVGSGGVLSWLISNRDKEVAVWILTASGRDVTARERPAIFLNATNTAGVSDTEGPWISSMVTVRAENFMLGLRLACGSFIYNLSSPDRDSRVFQDLRERLMTPSQGLLHGEGEIFEDEQPIQAPISKASSDQRTMDLFQILLFFFYLSLAVASS